MFQNSENICSQSVLNLTSMPGTSLDLGSLSLLVLVVIISCCVATLLSWCWVRSTSPRTFLYCSTCAQQLGVGPVPQAVLTDGIVARPWVEFVQPAGGGGGQQGAKFGDSATFQRLGMRTSRPGMGLELGQLETRPLSPVPCEGEDIEEVTEEVKDGEVKRNDKQQIFSPTSADVLARRDSVRSFALGSRMSRRTLVFPTPQSVAVSQQEKVNGPREVDQKILEKSSSLNSPSNTLIDAETDQLDLSAENTMLERIARDTRQRQVRRSVSARKEKSKYTLLRRQEEAGFTSQSEDERGLAGLRHRRQYTGVVNSEVVGAAKEMYQENSAQVEGGARGFTNPAFINSEESPSPSPLNQEKVSASRSSVISPLPHLHQSPSTVSPRPGYENLPNIQFPPRPSAAALPSVCSPVSSEEVKTGFII